MTRDETLAMEGRGWGGDLDDTSARIEFLRATGSSTHRALRRLLAEDAPLATTEVVLTELLAGARAAQDAADMRRLLLRGELLAVETPTDWESAAALYRACRRQDENGAQADGLPHRGRRGPPRRPGAAPQRRLRRPGAPDAAADGVNGPPRGGQAAAEAAGTAAACTNAAIVVDSSIASGCHWTPTA